VHPAGRPVLLPPAGVQGAAARRAASGGEDNSRERRAVAFPALQLLPSVAFCRWLFQLLHFQHQLRAPPRQHAVQCVLRPPNTACLPAACRSCLPLPQVHGDMQAAAVSEARQEIAILRACRDVNIVQFQVRRWAVPGWLAGWTTVPQWVCLANGLAGQTGSRRRPSRLRGTGSRGSSAAVQLWAALIGAAAGRSRRPCRQLPCTCT
jgi:hypothetical protein